MPGDKNVNRRSFFAEGLRQLMGNMLNPLEKAASAMAGAAPPSSPPRRAAVRWLRPPGALPEAALARTCTRGGDCVGVCPAHCIKIDPAGLKGGGLPYIDADSMACVVCTGLECMKVCPSGALVKTAVPDIDMGTAVWRRHTCVRAQGEPCTICVDKCPLGSIAIELTPRGIQVHDQGCIGCGLCQQHCPTSPKSIVVIPH